MVRFDDCYTRKKKGMKRTRTRWVAADLLRKRRWWWFW